MKVKKRIYHWRIQENESRMRRLLRWLTMWTATREEKPIPWSHATTKNTHSK